MLLSKKNHITSREKPASCINKNPWIKNGNWLICHKWTFYMVNMIRWQFFFNASSFFPHHWCKYTLNMKYIPFNNFDSIVFFYSTHVLLIDFKSFYCICCDIQILYVLQHLVKLYIRKARRCMLGFKCDDLRTVWANKICN